MVFILAGQFLIPSELVVDLVKNARGVELSELSVIAAIIRLENVAPDVVTTGHAYGKVLLATGAGRWGGSAAISCHATHSSDTVEQIIVFVIPIDKQGRRCSVSQPA